MNARTFRRHLTPGLIGTLLCACAVGPDYVRPKVETPSAYKEAVGWKPATPQDEAPRGRWWAVYGDAELDTLMDELHASNQTVKQAEAQYRAARALVQAARAAYFPTLNADASMTRAHAGTARSAATTAPGATTNTDAVSLDASWEPDLWGKLRRAAENAGENARASAADLAAARLSAEAELAQDYFQLRITDEEKRLYDANVAGLEKSLKITQNQYAVGVAAQADVAQAQTQLKSTQAAAIDLAITRGQLEHAIAVLCGRAASEFSITPAPLVVKVPNVPLGLPSDLLERRPDVAAGERLVAAANANIGVAKAAYFPDLTLAGAYGYQGSGWSGLISVADKVWSVGPALALNLFDAGARRAATRQAIANYDASVAAYRGTVLAAFQDVEDNLVALRVLADEIQVQDEATKAADQAETIAVNQYKSGIVSYLNVVVAQTTALANERASLSVRGRQLAASVALIKALGGGWDQSPTPTP
jgi:NodT family efflux transporter outer membrane factor (OMF) lipoprotein